MANIVPNPLNRFRKHDSSRPLHARWGDVSITAPTEGSWCQYDSAHQSAQKRCGYGPGYVPERRPRVLPSRPKQHPDHDKDEESSTSSSQRNSFAINNLNPRRLSMLLSRPKPVEGGGEGRQRQRDIESGVDFAYKPIKHDYSTEVAEISHNRRSRFRYIPTSPPYGDLEAIGPHSQSASPYDQDSWVERSDGPRRHQGHSALRYEDDIDDDYEEEDRDHRAYRGSFYPRRMVGLEKKRYSSRRMTTVMVPDAEDIYG